MSPSLTGRLYVRPEDKPEQHSRGRRCHQRGCITRLSVFNGGQHCWAHQRKLATQHRRDYMAELRDLMEDG